MSEPLGEQIVTYEDLMALSRVIRDYAQHDSWRCMHPDRWPQDEDCPCGLLGALRAAGFDPEPWRVKAEEQRR